MMSIKYSVQGVTERSWDSHSDVNTFVASGADRVTDVLDRAERLVAARPDITLLSARRRIRRSDDD